MQKALGIVVGLVVVVVLIGVVLGYLQSRQLGGRGGENRVVIAADFPMTGNLAYYGEVVGRGLQLAVDRYNRERGEADPEVVLRIEDNYGKVSEGVQVFNKVVDQDGAVAVVSLFTPHSVALLPASANRRIVLYATVTSVVEFGVKSPFAFRDYISLPSQGEQMARYLHEVAKVATVGSLVVNDDYGLDSLRLCKTAFLKRGGSWTTEEVFEQRDISIRDPAAKVVASNPDAIYIAGRELSLANAVRQTRELGFEGVIVSNNGFDTPTVFQAVGSAGNGVAFTSSTFDTLAPTSPEQAEFIEEYRSRFQQEPDYNAAHGHTIGQALTRAIREGRSDPERLRAYLQGYDTVDMLGEAKMTAIRDVSREVAIYHLEGGKRVRVDLD